MSLEIPTPLRPWLWCGLWVALIWSSLVFMDEQDWLGVKNFSLHETLESDLRQLSKFGERNGDAIKILALGDSLLGTSLPGPYAFNKLLGADIHWHHFTMRAASRVDFVPFLKDIRLIRPDVIIVQDSLLKPVQPPPAKLQRAFYNVRQIPGKLFRLWNGITEKPFDEPGRRVFNRTGFAESIPTDPESLEFLAELYSATDSLIVINLPRSENVHGGEAKAAWLKYLEEELSTLNVPVLVVGEPLPIDHYKIDQAHPNEKGRQVRTALLKQLVEEHVP